MLPPQTKSASTNSSGYTCPLCPLHPSVILKWKTGGHPTFSNAPLPQRKHGDLRSMWMEYQSDIILLLLLEVFNEWWQLIFQIFVQPSIDDVSCQLRNLINTGGYTSFSRFHYLRWMRMRTMMSSRWRARVRTMRSFYTRLVQLWRVLV